jgi:hypothetical protein
MDQRRPQGLESPSGRYTRKLEAGHILKFNMPNVPKQFYPPKREGTMRDVTGPLGELLSEAEQVEIEASNPESPVDTGSEYLLEGSQGLSDTPGAGNPPVEDKFLTDKG